MNSSKYNYDVSRLFKIATLLKDNKDMILLIPKTLFSPGDNFSKVIRKATYHKILETLVGFFSFYSPLMVVFGISYMFKLGLEFSLFGWIFTIIYSLLMGACTGISFGISVLILGRLGSGVFYFLGKFFGGRGSFHEVFSAIGIYISAASIFALPEFLLIVIFKNFGYDYTLLMVILLITMIFFHILYLPIALSKSLKINRFKSFIIALFVLIAYGVVEFLYG